MSVPAQSLPSLMQHRPFVLFWLARLASTMGYQMLAVTIGWQVYELTDSAFDLGLVGLIQFVPAVVLTLLIGGFGSLLIAGIWMLLFPDLRRIDRFEPADKKPTET